MRTLTRIIVVGFGGLLVGSLWASSAAKDPSMSFSVVSWRIEHPARWISDVPYFGLPDTWAKIGDKWVRVYTCGNPFLRSPKGLVLSADGESILINGQWLSWEDYEAQLEDGI